jgi:hypothetical protein
MILVLIGMDVTTHISCQVSSMFYVHAIPGPLTLTRIFKLWASSVAVGPPLSYVLKENAQYILVTPLSFP